MGFKPGVFSGMLGDSGAAHPLQLPQELKVLTSQSSGHPEVSQV